MHTNKQIIQNQNQFKDQIFFFFANEVKSIKNELRGIESEDEFILKEKRKLLSRFKKLNTLNSIKKYFFNSSKRDETYYVWWDDQLQEALILTYGKK